MVFLQFWSVLMSVACVVTRGHKTMLMKAEGQGEPAGTSLLLSNLSRPLLNTDPRKLWTYPHNGAYPFLEIPLPCATRDGTSMTLEELILIAWMYRNWLHPSLDGDGLSGLDWPAQLPSSPTPVSLSCPTITSTYHPAEAQERHGKIHTESPCPGSATGYLRGVFLKAQ